MGNAMPSTRTERNESVINLSDNCVNRITRDSEGKGNDKSKTQDLPEDEWVDKLQCMDEVHSLENGISYQNVMHLINNIEAQLQDLRPAACDCEALISCMKKHENCIIKCKKYVDEFISCVDAERVNIIKEKYDMETRVNLKGSDLAKQFLKEEQE